MTIDYEIIQTEFKDERKCLSIIELFILKFCYMQ